MTLGKLQAALCALLAIGSLCSAEGSKEKKDPPIAAAIKAGDFAAFQKQVKSAKKPGALDGTDARGLSFLELTIRYGHADMAELLIKAGASPTALVPALEASMTSIAALLIERGAIPDARAMEAALKADGNAYIKRESLELKNVGLLVEKGCRAFDVPYRGSVKIGAIGAMDAIPMLNYVSSVASENPRKDELVDLMLRSGLDLDAKTSNGVPVIHFALLDNDAKLVKKILESGLRFDPNSKDDQGRAPLYLAMLRGKHEFVKPLLDRGANASIGDGRYSPVHFVLNLDELKLLEAAGANLGAAAPNGYTALHRAASLPDPAMAEYLLGKGGDYKAIVTKISFASGKVLANATPYEFARFFDYAKTAEVFRRKDPSFVAQRDAYLARVRQLETDKTMIELRKFLSLKAEKKYLEALKSAYGTLDIMDPRNGRDAKIAATLIKARQAGSVAIDDFANAYQGKGYGDSPVEKAIGPQLRIESLGHECDLIAESLRSIGEVSDAFASWGY